MLKRILSAVLLVAVLAVTGLASVGCNNKPAVVVEVHEEENTTRTVGEPELRVE